MSQVVYRGNTASASFPFISKYQGRSIIVPGQDNNFNRLINSSADLDKDVGIPQVYYCHNVMPSGQGMQSIGYETRIAGYPIGSGTSMSQAFILRDDSLSRKVYMMVDAHALIFIEDANIGYEASIAAYWNGTTFVGFPANFTAAQITTAHVAGITYIYIAAIGCFIYNITLRRLELVTLAGLDPATILGITETSGYLIAYTKNSVAWSSLIDPTDFVPSLATGAGGGTVEGIKGNITCAAPTSAGFTIFTTSNAVSVLYTGNTRYPFQFSECVGAGGVTSLERVTYEADTGYNYIYSSKGFQLIQAKSCQTIFPEITDFIAGQEFEDFDEVSKTFSYQTLTLPMAKKLNLIAARYLVLSYGVSSLTHAIVYDTVMKRFGKFKLPHVDVFEYELLGDAVSDIPRKSIALLQANGTVVVVNFSLPFSSRAGVILFGKYQYVRSRLLQLQTVEIEDPGADLICECWTSLEGKGYDYKIPAVPISLKPELAIYAFDSPAGKNHSIYLSGAFNLETLLLSFNVHGRM